VNGGTLGSYRLERELGRGGMGAVYVGVHTLLGRRAAVKVLLPELSRHQAIVQRFFNEARAATAIKHPGIVEIYDFGFAADGSAYIVMELLAGESLADRLRRGPLPLATAIQIARQTATALGAAHRSGIVHRDLKPDNVFLVPDAETALGERVKLLDFGIAKLVDPGEVGRTHAGSVMGTPMYMAPEQCRGASDLDHRADLYALGCVLHEMVAGAPPFVGDAAGVVLGAHLHLPPPPLRSLVPHATAELEAAVLRLLAKDPAARPASADAVAAELVAVGEPLGLSRPSGLHATPPITGGAATPRTTLGGASGQLARTANLRRGRRIALAAGLALLVTAGGAAVALIGRPDPAPAPVAAVAVAAVAVDAGTPSTAPLAPPPEAPAERAAGHDPERQAGTRPRQVAASQPRVPRSGKATPKPAPVPKVSTSEPDPAAIAKSRANIAKLAAARTGMVGCDAYLHTYAKLLACPRLPADTAARLDADEMIALYARSVNGDGANRAQLDASCVTARSDFIRDARARHPGCALP
jgi:tRNA A-37 threonylcarbamoyl transferase component Bud32